MALVGVVILFDVILLVAWYLTDELVIERRYVDDEVMQLTVI